MQILMHHIKATLPDIKQKISQNLSKYEAELASLGGPQGESNNVSRSSPGAPRCIAHADRSTEQRRSANHHRILRRIPHGHRR